MDRNNVCRSRQPLGLSSLSARRAWIEIDMRSFGGADCSSLSARRAWIEILGVLATDFKLQSLSARRAWIEILFCVGFSSGANGRSPQGERG